MMRAMDSHEIERHAEEILVEGYTLVESFVTAPTVDRMLERVKAQHRSQRELSLRGRPAKELGEQVHNLHNKDKFFLEVLFEVHDHPLVSRVLREHLQDPFYHSLPSDVPNYILGFYNARSSGAALKLHMDTFIPSAEEKTWTMQVGWALEDSTLANGCTLVVPRSHRSGTFVDYDRAKPKPILARRGDLVIWDSRIWHGTRDNISGGSRWFILSVFTPWWVKQRTDITRSLPDEIYQQLDDRQKCLLGFCSIPPKDEEERVHFKGGYADLRPSVSDYY